MFDNARLLDLIERALDTDPFCPACGAPTTIKDDDGRLWLVCSATLDPVGGRSAHQRRDPAPPQVPGGRPVGAPRRLIGRRDARAPPRWVPSHPWRSSSRRSTPPSSTPRRGSTSTPPRRVTPSSRPQVDRANELYHVEDAPEISDAEYDAAVPRARRARDGLPGADDLGIADPARRRHPDRHLRRGPPPPADAVAVERLQPRRAAGVRRPRPPRASACRPPRSRPRSCATSRSSRSTASRSACATSAAGSSRARPAATGRPART